MISFNPVNVWDNICDDIVTHAHFMTINVASAVQCSVISVALCISSDHVKQIRYTMTQMQTLLTVLILQMICLKYLVLQLMLQQQRYKSVTLSKILSLILETLFVHNSLGRQFCNNYKRWGRSAKQTMHTYSKTALILSRSG